jgi:AcrR family transcriptional regulator
MPHVATDITPERSFDLRERKRTKTRLMIQTEALRLIEEQGYAQTTVEQIAHAAAISPRTFFRYFPTKEDVVMWDEYDPVALELLESRPPDEPLAETFRFVMRETLGGLYRRDPQRLLARVRLLATVPELRARFADMQAESVDELVPVLESKLGSKIDALRLRIIGTALVATARVALDRWQEGDGKGDLLAIFDGTVDVLVMGLNELHPAR